MGNNNIIIEVWNANNVKTKKKLTYQKDSKTRPNYDK